MADLQSFQNMSKQISTDVNGSVKDYMLRYTVVMQPVGNVENGTSGDLKNY